MSCQLDGGGPSIALAPTANHQKISQASFLRPSPPPPLLQAEGREGMTAEEEEWGGIEKPTNPKRLSSPPFPPSPPQMSCLPRRGGKGRRRALLHHYGTPDNADERERGRGGRKGFYRTNELRDSPTTNLLQSIETGECFFSSSVIFHSLAGCLFGRGADCEGGGGGGIDNLFGKLVCFSLLQVTG